MLIKHSIQSSQNRGFTLIELLVTVSVISLLSSIVFLSVNVSKAKAIDASKIIDAKQVSAALLAYNDAFNTMPKNYLKDGNFVSDGSGNNIAFEDKVNPGSQSDLAYNASMKELVDADLLPEIPHSRKGEPYGYFDYGPQDSRGVLFITGLEVTPQAVPGSSGSCQLTYSAPVHLLRDSNGNVVTDGTCGSDIYHSMYYCNYYYEDGSTCLHEELIPACSNGRLDCTGIVPEICPETLPTYPVSQLQNEYCAYNPY